MNKRLQVILYGRCVFVKPSGCTLWDFTFKWDEDFLKTLKKAPWVALLLLISRNYKNSFKYIFPVSWSLIIYAVHSSPSLAILQGNAEHWNEAKSEKTKLTFVSTKAQTIHSLSNTIVHLCVTSPVIYYFSYMDRKCDMWHPSKEDEHCATTGQ